MRIALPSRKRTRDRKRRGGPHLGELLKQLDYPLPKLNPAPFACYQAGDSFHDDYYTGVIYPWTGFSDEVAQTIVALRQKCGIGIDNTSRSQEEDPEIVLAWYETTVNGRWVQNAATPVGRVLEAAFSAQLISKHLVFGDHGAIPRLEIPVLAGLLDIRAQNPHPLPGLLIFEIKTPFPKGHQRLAAYVDEIFRERSETVIVEKLRKALGQVIRYLNASQARVAVLSWYDGTIFVRRRALGISVSRCFGREEEGLASVRNALLAVCIWAAEGEGPFADSLVEATLLPIVPYARRDKPNTIAMSAVETIVTRTPAAPICREITPDLLPVGTSPSSIPIIQSIPHGLRADEEESPSVAAATRRQRR
ncbi:Dihydroorotate dehydrogenase (quinone), mitochondrial [Sphaceloma murrayae]|uniref:Dihydroorotate dehydrogenase (Quinone), mitochondrial n=1 Tax=Sphaceloma murrayae TaxID=2082308 RepID=A0A2K1QPR9_9PEZI|nr:Dihydroorotate dehydrogenase (quinone), mitochondrial [Sphaceloma murrayae]